MYGTEYSERQLKFVAILPMISGPPSIIGSSLILYRILRDKKKKLAKLYYRIQLGFCIFDIISSFAYTLSTLPSPTGTPHAWGAIGNSDTCTAQGFLIQLGFCVVYYNTMLLLYFLLIIRYNVFESKFKRGLEIKMHMAILVITLFPCFIGVLLGMFNNVGNICSFGAYPKGCEFDANVKCERAEKAYMYLVFSSGWIVTLLLFVLPFNLVASIWNLWKREQEIFNKYEFTSFDTSQDSINNRKVTTDVVEEGRRLRSRRVKSSYRFKKIGVQASYLCASYVVCVASLVYRIIAEKAGANFVMLCLTQFTYPLQGFLNFLNYVRPRVIRLKDDKLAKTWLYGVFLTIFVSDDELRRRKLQVRLLAKKKTRSTPCQCL